MKWLLVTGLVVALLATLALLAWVGRQHIRSVLPDAILEPAIGTLVGFRVERPMIPMRDGVRLATTLYVPTRTTAPLATILVRTPYGRTSFRATEGVGLAFVRGGFAVAVQDMRGRYASEGVFSPYRHDTADGVDTIEWISRQAWSNGRVGTFGCSALGESQLILARARHPGHAAIVAEAPGGAAGTVGGRYGYFGVFEGGVFNLASGFGWFVDHGSKSPGQQAIQPFDSAKALQGLPSRDLVARHRADPTDYEDFISRPLADPGWRDFGYLTDQDRFATPAMIIDTWHDQSVAGTLAMAELMRRNWDGAPDTRHHVIIAPGNHCDWWSPTQTGRVGDLPVGPATAQPIQEWMIDWFAHRLQGRYDRRPQLPPYRFYVLGEDVWKDSDTWPPAGVQYRRWHLGSATPANSANGGGTLTREAPKTASPHFDQIRHDPMNPVPSRGGPVCCTGNPDDRAGPIDQREIEARDDVLVYTSDPLPEPLRIAGPITAEIHLSSSARDTDLVVKLVDVWPDGLALNVQEGALRLRYRNGFEKPELMVPGKVYRVHVDMRAIAYQFAAGHRMRIQIASSNFPRLERNLGTGGRNYDESEGATAINSIYSDKFHTSAILLPEWEPP